jgi:hypothetical protein
MTMLSFLSDWRLDEVLVWALIALVIALLAAAPIFARRWRRGAKGKTATDEGANASERAIGWRPLYPYIKERRFTQWKPEDVTASVAEETCPLAIKLFISHRWQTPDDPDPRSKTLPAIIEYLSRVFMTANGLLDANSYLVKELVVGDELRNAFCEETLGRCTCGSVGWLDVRSVLAPDDPFFQRVIDVHQRRAFYRLLKHVRIWYDYTSLPQARATSQERAVFDRVLNRLAGIAAESEVLALWGLESVKRAWCIFEVLAAKKVYFCAPAQAEFDFMQKALFKAHGYADLADYRGRPSQSILIQAKWFRSSIAGLSEQEIEAYLRQEHFDCTKDEDFGRVARLIRQYLREEEMARGE